MSGPDETERDKGFLARWSQRKQEARQAEPKQDAPAAESLESPRSPAPTSEDAAPEFDLLSLPKLEELTGSSDITAFLRKGVPEHLRNAALRKSWALDPAIRNYVNPALEYAYDWNAPGGVPGGGELGAGVDVARLVAQIVGEPAAENIKSDANPGDGNTGSPTPPPERELQANPHPEVPVQPVRSVEELEEKEVDSKAEGYIDETTMHASQSIGTVAPQQPLRRHGTAKPIV